MISHSPAPWTCAALLAAFLASAATAQTNTGAPSSASPTPTLQTTAASQNAALPSPLTVEEAVRIGLERNPQTLAGAAGVASARANYRSLTALPNPQLGISHAEGSSTVASVNGKTTDTFIDLSEAVDTSGQRRFQAAGAKAQLGVTLYQFDETKAGLNQKIRDAYWSLAAARALAKYGQESLQEAQRLHQLTETQLQAGAAPKVDVIRSSIDVANAQQANVAAQGAERTALTALNVLLARPPAAPVTLADDITVGVDAKAPVLPLPDLPTLTKTALANRGLVKSATEQVHVAEYAVKQARAGRLPDLSVDYQRSLQEPQDTVVLSVRLPLFDLGSSRHAAQAADETRKQATALKDQAEQQVTQEVTQAVQDATQAQTQLTSYLTDILNPSITLRDLAEIGYQQGATGILPLIDAESTLRSARTGYVNSLLAAHKAQDALSAALGGPAPR